MTNKQYEELCRHFLAELFQIRLDQVRSLELANPWRPALPSYAHQIDLYWETETEAAHYVHIANAKWQTPPYLLEQADVLLLHQVKTKVAAHKAILITNVGFSEGASCRDAIQRVTNLDKLRRLHRRAVRCASIEEFQRSLP